MARIYFNADDLFENEKFYNDFCGDCDKRLSVIPYDECDRTYWSPQYETCLKHDVYLKLVEIINKTNADIAKMLLPD